MVILLEKEDKITSVVFEPNGVCLTLHEGWFNNAKLSFKCDRSERGALGELRGKKIKILIETI